MIGTWEIVVILFLVLLLFGGKRLPELAKSLGKGIHEFKKASQGIDAEIQGKAPPSAKSDEKDEEAEKP